MKLPIIYIADFHCIELGNLPIHMFLLLKLRSYFWAKSWNIVQIINHTMSVSK